MMITSSLLLSGMIAGDLIAINFTIFITVNHGTTELRPAISIQTWVLLFLHESHPMNVVITVMRLIWSETDISI